MPSRSGSSDRLSNQSAYQDAQSGSSPSTIRYTMWCVSAASCSRSAICAVAVVPGASIVELRITLPKLASRRAAGSELHERHDLAEALLGQRAKKDMARELGLRCRGA